METLKDAVIADSALILQALTLLVVAWLGLLTLRVKARMEHGQREQATKSNQESIASDIKVIGNGTLLQHAARADDARTRADDATNDKKDENAANGA
jgi:hypothetical protein